MLKAFARLVAGGKPKTSCPNLPPELIGHAQRRETAPLVHWLSEALKRSGDAPELPALLDVVRQAGWHEHDVVKLTVAAAHRAGRWGLLLEWAAATFDGANYRDADLCLMAAQALYELNRIDEAEQAMSAALSRFPSLAERADGLRLAAAIAYAVNRIETAHGWIAQLRRQFPQQADNGLSLSICFEFGDESAVDEILRALTAAPAGDAMDEIACAVVALAREDYAAGFARFEKRFALADATKFVNGALFDRPRWHGEPLAGRSVLVAAEQGLGDTVMMARYLPLLREKGAGAVMLEAQGEAAPLLQASFPDVAVVERRMGAVPSAPTFDLWVGMMSLPHLFGTTAETVPARAGYLRVPQESAAYWRQRVAELAPPGRPRIGLCWSGRRIHRADRRRSLPVEAAFAHLASLPAVFFAVQKEVPQQHPPNLIDVADELVTLADTAALIEAMDLVVTIDSAPAHLAGALGKECWLMLPYRYEWRWGISGEKNRWYDAVRIFRQGRQGDWGTVLQQVFAARLPAWIAERGR